MHEIFELLYLFMILDHGFQSLFPIFTKDQIFSISYHITKLFHYHFMILVLLFNPLSCI